MKLIPLLAVAGAAAWFYNRSRKSRLAGSPTNASSAVDDIAPLGSRPSKERVIDEAVQETFPASDPVSVKPAETAYEKKQRLGS